VIRARTADQDDVSDAFVCDSVRDNAAMIVNQLLERGAVACGAADERNHIVIKYTAGVFRRFIFFHVFLLGRLVVVLDDNNSFLA
jgi:hypothetical protein